MHLCVSTTDQEINCLKSCRSVRVRGVDPLTLSQEEFNNIDIKTSKKMFNPSSKMEALGQQALFKTSCEQNSPENEALKKAYMQ